MSDTGQQDGAWTIQAAREITTEGATCALHGYMNCGICAVRAARWLLALLTEHAERTGRLGEAAQRVHDDVFKNIVNADQHFANWQALRLALAALAPPVADQGEST